MDFLNFAPDGDEFIIIFEDTEYTECQARQSAKLDLQSSNLGLPTPSPASINNCDIFKQYYATKNIHTIVPTL
jgi:hypothetical protein